MPFFYIDNANGNIIARIKITTIVIPIPISSLKFFFVIANIIPIIVAIIIIIGIKISIVLITIILSPFRKLVYMNFFKRFLSLILTFILIFSISVPCYASDSNSDKSDPAGWDSWSFDEKYDFVLKQGMNLLYGFTGIVHGDVSAIEEILLDFYASRPESGVSNFYEYLANGLSFDDSTDTWTLSDDLINFLNDFITNYNDQVTMVYRYPVKSASVSAENFPNKIMYDYFQKILLNYSDCYAFFLTINGQSSGINMRGWPVTDLSGSEYKLPYDSTSDGAIRVNIIPRPLAGVSNYLDLASASTTLYNDNWETSFYPRSFWILPDGRIFTYSSKQILGYGSSYKELDFDNLPAYDDLETQYYWSWYGTSHATFLDPNHSCSLSVGCLYSASSDPLNVYKSEADMKKDIGSQFVGSYTNTYTGTTVNNITQTEINNIVNNYYPSDPDPDPDDPGGGGSGSDSKDYTFLLQRIISEIQNLNFSDLNDTLKEIKVLVSNLSQNLYDFSDMDSNISEMNKSIKDILEQLQDLNDNLVALARALVGKDTFEDALSGVKSNFPDPDDIMLAAYDELNNLLPENDTSIGGALGDIFKQLLDFQTPIDDLVQDEEYIDEIEDLLKQLLPKDPEKNDDDSLFDKLLKNIELSLQLYANSVDEVKETSKTKFPFSIGYDIELLLLVLSAEPQTPVFNIPFEYARLNYKTNIIVDFSMFDDAIDVIRFFLTIYYIFFLLMITPKMVGLNNEVDS